MWLRLPYHQRSARLYGGSARHLRAVDRGGASPPNCLLYEWAIPTGRQGDAIFAACDWAFHGTRMYLCGASELQLPTGAAAGQVQARDRHPQRAMGELERAPPHAGHRPPLLFCYDVDYGVYHATQHMRWWGRRLPHPACAWALPCVRCCALRGSAAATAADLCQGVCFYAREEGVQRELVRWEEEREC